MQLAYFDLTNCKAVRIQILDFFLPPDAPLCGNVGQAIQQNCGGAAAGLYIRGGKWYCR